VEHRTVAFDGRTIEAALSAIPLGGLRVFQTVSSTNDVALAWASAGAMDLSLVVADEQSAGRGRSGRRWSTPAGSALALTLILRGKDDLLQSTGRLSGLGAMAVADACYALGLLPSIKWPNDVLLQGKKVAGVLVEALWSGDSLEAAVVGIGINVLSGSTPSSDTVRYAATSIEAQAASPTDRIRVLQLVVAALIERRRQVQTRGFLDSWNERLAFRGKDVLLTREGAESIRGRLDGIDEEGGLRLDTAQGTRHFSIGEVQLAAADDTIY
jgi:BirA family transcriptional regulator, biotin operon repressor / biotin---[acetyl-CoA-carboxylase] ligase